MRPGSCRSAISIVVLMVGAAAAPTAGASAVTDACPLLTQAQLSAALAVPMDAGKYVTPGFVKTCTWTPSNGPAPGIKYFTLSLQSVEAFEGGKKLAQSAQDKGAAVA